MQLLLPVVLALLVVVAVRALWRGWIVQRPGGQLFCLSVGNRQRNLHLYLGSSQNTCHEYGLLGSHENVCSFGNGLLLYCPSGSRNWQRCPKTPTLESWFRSPDDTRSMTKIVGRCYYVINSTISFSHGKIIDSDATGQELIRLHCLRENYNWVST